jgi:hypothetical protein
MWFLLLSLLLLQLPVATVVTAALYPASTAAVAVLLAAAMPLL